MKRRLIALLMITALVCTLSYSVSAVTELDGDNNSYVFSYWGDTAATPTPYTAKGQVSLAKVLSAASSLEDITVDDNGNYYVADSASSCIYVVGSDLKLKATISTYEQDGKKTKFQACEGVWYAAGKLYIANTAGQNIIILDAGNYSTLQLVKAPTAAEWSSDVDFEPIRLSTDGGGRIYVISRNQTQGIVQFSKEGKFIGYLGALEVTPNLWNIFIRTFGSKEMKKRSLQMVPTEFTNLTCNDEGMVFAITETVTDSEIYGAVKSRSGSNLPIRLFNPLGNDILKNKGYYPPAGDVDFTLWVDSNSGASRFADVAVGPNGIYSVLDGKREKVFTYDSDGNLLYVFGGEGSGEGEFIQAVSLVYNGDDIAVLDKSTGYLTVFKPTDFTQKVLLAYKLHDTGDNEGEVACWKELQKEFQGYDLTYLALGKAAYNQGDYQTAMKYLKIANNKTYYSKAFKSYQSEFVETNLGWLMAGLVLAIATAVLLIKAIRKRLKCSRSALVQSVQYGGYVMTHPFNGFWELKWEAKGTASGASVILLAFFLVRLICERCQPYLFCNIDLEQTNVFVSSLSYVAILFLWVVASWCFTTLFDGKGTIKDIYIYTCYSLVPYVLFSLPILLLGHFLTLEVASLYNTLNIVIMVYFILLLFVGTLTVHQFSLFKTIIMIVFSIAGVALLIFLIILCGGLIGDIYDCIISIIKEISLRY